MLIFYECILIVGKRKLPFTVTKQKCDLLKVDEKKRKIEALEQLWVII